MNEDRLNITQSDLQSLGFSGYWIRKICKGLAFSRMKSGAKLYKRAEVKASIEEKISQPRIQPKTKEHLQVALDLLDGKSNVIEVDFLKNLSRKEKIEFLTNNREELRQKGEAILRDVDEVLRSTKSSKKFTLIVSE